MARVSSKRIDPVHRALLCGSARWQTARARAATNKWLVERGKELLPVKYVIPAGGLSADHTQWVHPRYSFFLPVKVLSRVFRGKFIAGLKRAFCQHKLVFPGSLKPLAEAKAFHAFLRPLFRQDWVVYSKRPFGGLQHVLQYLARYTHRVAISNHRIVHLADGKLTFRWKDYAHKGKQKLMTVTAKEFLRRFLLHTLPRVLCVFASAAFLLTDGAALPRCQALLRNGPLPVEPSPATPAGPWAWPCPCCGGPMTVIEKLTAQQIRWRSAGRESFCDTS